MRVPSFLPLSVWLLPRVLFTPITATTSVGLGLSGLAGSGAGIAAPPLSIPAAAPPVIAPEVISETGAVTAAEQDAQEGGSSLD